MQKKSPPPSPPEFNVEVQLRARRCEKKAPDGVLRNRCRHFNFELGGKGAFFSHRPVPNISAIPCSEILRGGDGEDDEDSPHKRTQTQLEPDIDDHKGDEAD